MADLAATTTIDWATFRVDTIDLSGGTDAPTVSWTGTSSLTEADANTYIPPEWDTDFDAGDFASSLHASATTTRASGDGWRDNDQMKATAWSQSDALAGKVVGKNDGWGESRNMGTVELSGHGLFVISVDWTMNFAGTVGDSDSDGSGYVELYFAIEDGQESTFMTVETYRSTLSDGYGEFTGTSALHVFNAGPTVSGMWGVGITASSQSASVPEPGSFALMLIGLEFVGWGARRRFK